MTLYLTSIASVILCFAPQGSEDSFQEPPSEYARQGLSRMHQHQMMTPEKLNTAQREVYSSLTPTYQRVYLYAFSGSQRDKAVYLVAHGKTPLEAVNSVLNQDSGLKSQNGGQKSACAPSEKCKRW